MREFWSVLVHHIYICTASPPLIDFSSFLHLLFLESGVAAAWCNGVSSLDLARSEDVTHVDAARRKGLLSTVRGAMKVARGGRPWRHRQRQYSDGEQGIFWEAAWLPRRIAKKVL